MKKARPTYLKVSISLDLEQEADQRLLEFFDALPAGMKANALRRLLAQSLPKSDAELQVLLGQVAMDAHLRNQCAGRPRHAERASAPMRALPVVVAPHVVPAGAGAAALPVTDGRAPIDEEHEAGVIADAVVPVAGAIDGTGAKRVAMPSIDEELGRGQGSRPDGAASEAPARRRLNVGGLIPSFSP